MLKKAAIKRMDDVYQIVQLPTEEYYGIHKIPMYCEFTNYETKTASYCYYMGSTKNDFWLYREVERGRIPADIGPTDNNAFIF